MRHRSSAALAIALVVGAVVVPAGSAASAAPTPAAGDRVQALTLITGDRITVDGNRMLVKPRKGIQFFQFRDGTHRYVVPSDAAPLLRADRLDQRLFDVSTLLGDDVEKRADLPLVMADASVVAGLSATRTLSAVDGFATRIPVRDLAARWPALKTNLTRGKLWLDAIRTPTLDVSVPRTGAPEAWARGLDGTGVTVAVLDSGIDDTHPDLAGKVVARKNFVADYEDGRDVKGHGTHVASTIAGTGAASGGRYKGVAPGAKLLDGKICAQFGCPESAILDGMRWAAESGVKVVNMSLGGTDTPGIDPIEAAVNDLSARYDMLFVIAAGNDYGAMTVNSPGSADAALTVGGVNKDGSPADYSSKGPRLEDYAVKPEITAPGTDITAARSSFFDDGTTGDPYVTFSGTSMATPHVAGAAAIMTEAHPDWSASQRKEALIGSARPNPDATIAEQGAGELTIPAALDQPITAEPATVGFGFRRYPQSADDQVTRTLTYRNTSDVAVTLKLDTPSFVSSSDTVTVPANGTASVEVTAHATDVGVSTGRIIATAPGTTVQTPVSIFREEPSADLGLTTLDRVTGSPGTAVTFVENVETGRQYVSYEPTTRLRVPFGRYFIGTIVFETDGTSTMMVNAETTVDTSMYVVLDGRKALPADITVPDHAAQPVAAFAQAFLTGEHQIDATLQGDSPGQLFFADFHTGPAVPNLTAQFNATFARPDNTAAYTTGWHQNGRFATGFTKHVGGRDLTAVRTEYAANTPGASGQRSNFPAEPRIPYAAGTALPATKLPAVRTEYYAGNTPWQSEFVESDAAGQSLTTLDQPAVAARDRDRAERWNGAVFAYPLTPALPEFPTIARRQDELLVRLTNYGDSGGHLGFSNVETNQHMTLSRGGRVVDQRDSSLAGFDVSPGKARFRVDYSSTQPTSRLSTRIDQSWEFTSNTTASETAVPLTAVGFAPDLDLGNTARAGRPTSISLPVTSQGKAAKLRDVDVEVSFDDGATWHRTPVTNPHGEWVTSVRSPSRPGFVSLRATAMDSVGNRTTVSVLRAYATK